MYCVIRSGFTNASHTCAAGGAMLIEVLDEPPLHSARGADSEQFWFLTAVWFSDRPSRYAAAQADAPKLDTAKRLARTYRIHSGRGSSNPQAGRRSGSRRR